MSYAAHCLIVLIASLTISAPAQAQAIPPAEVAARAQPDAALDEAEEAISAEEAAFNVRSAALGQRVLAVDEEMKSVARLGALDPDGAKTALDEIETGLQSEINDFVQAFLHLASEKAESMPEIEAEVLRTNAASTANYLTVLPRSMRERAETAARSPPSSEVAPPNE